MRGKLVGKCESYGIRRYIWSMLSFLEVHMTTNWIRGLFITAVITLGFSQTSKAIPHYLRVCNVTGGEYLEIFAGNDRLPFCMYGSSKIGADTVAQWTEDKISTQARLVFLAKDKFCEDSGGKTEMGKRVYENGVEGPFGFCRYSDGSLISLGTLIMSGSESPSNLQLRALLQ